MPTSIPDLLRRADEALSAAIDTADFDTEAALDDMLAARLLIATARLSADGAAAAPVTHEAAPDNPATDSTDKFDAVTGLLDYPMYIVTTAADGECAGCLVGFAGQTSIDPPRFLVGLSDKNHTFRVAARANRLVVHLLDAQSRSLAELFGATTADDTDKFARCRWQSGPAGIPVLDDAAAWFSGLVIDRVRTGDHVGFLLDVDTAEVRRAPERLLLLSDVSDLDPGHDA
jgi:flavin reductase (DIM6/NTAB) family NADH-FMN oxidoreductase RutF